MVVVPVYPFTNFSSIIEVLMGDLWAVGVAGFRVGIRLSV